VLAGNTFKSFLSKDQRTPAFVGAISPELRNGDYPNYKFADGRSSVQISAALKQALANENWHVRQPEATGLRIN
jgi:hypothetical protein